MGREVTMGSFAGPLIALALAGSLVGCGATTEPPPLADAGAASCSDRLLDGEETGIDCGGPCAACAVGEGCFGEKDCATRVCQSFVCQEASCGNGVRDQGESDVDCGGSCGFCEPGRVCHGDDDCSSNQCTDGRCTQATCHDGKENQDETGVDCGGTCRLAGQTCENGQNCQTSADCQSRLCIDFVCKAKT
jgi:hypothetical protein